MGTTYYDSEGKATFLFDNVPIRAVKKAFFKDKLGTLHTLLKLVYNSVTYDFNETAQGGAVVFANNYTGWEFIAPDDRLDFTEISGMTLGAALTDIRETLASAPVPAWDKFAAWVENRAAYPKYVISQSAAYIKPTSGAYTQISPPDFTAMSGESFVDFLDVLITAVGSSGLSMSDFMTSDTGFECVIQLRNSSNGSTLITMTFKFRE